MSTSTEKIFFLNTPHHFHKRRKAILNEIRNQILFLMVEDKGDLNERELLGLSRAINYLDGHRSICDDLASKFDSTFTYYGKVEYGVVDIKRWLQLESSTNDPRKAL